MATRHRRDMTKEDFLMLARFVHALDVVYINMHSPALELGVTTMLLPTWYVAAGVWKVADYKEYTEEAIGISRNHMQTVCNYLGIRMWKMLDVLYRFSMLAVAPGTQGTDKEPHFRQPFFGIPREYADWPEAVTMQKHVRQGFVLEKRRTIGGFRKRS